MKNRKLYNILIISLSVVCLAAAVVFGVPGILTFNDNELGNLLSDTIPRLAISIVLIALMLNSDYASGLKPDMTEFGRKLVWSIPCFLVAIVNFPFTALIGGSAIIDRADLVWLFLIKCISIALLEELFFRAILFPFFLDRLKTRQHSTFLAIIFSSALFSLMHLINLFFGADTGYTLLQVGYTFLIGCMLAVTFLKTKNIWLCVAVHFIFDIGGTIVTDLGNGSPWDMTFWILTAVIGVFCTVHIVLTLIKLIRTEKQN